MRIIIDRFEGDYVVCEDDNKVMIKIKRNILPENAKEGDVIKEVNNQLQIDIKETKARSNKIKKLMDNLWE